MGQVFNLPAAEGQVENLPYGGRMRDASAPSATKTFVAPYLGITRAM